MLCKSQFNVPQESTPEGSRRYEFESGLPMVICYDFYAQRKGHGIPAFAYWHDEEHHRAADAYYDDPHKPSDLPDDVRALQDQIDSTFQDFINTYLDNTYDVHDEGSVEICYKKWSLKFLGTIEIITYEDFEHTL